MVKWVFKPSHMCVATGFNQGLTVEAHELDGNIAHIIICSMVKGREAIMAAT